MFAIFTYLLFLFSYSYQLLIFYKLNQYRLGSIKDILKIIIILVISIIILDFIIGQAIFLILVIFFYSKKSQLSKIVSTILFANLITYAADLFIRLIGLSFPIITSYFVPIAVTYYVLVYFLIKRVKLHQLFIKKKLSSSWINCLCIYSAPYNWLNKYESKSRFNWNFNYYAPFIYSIFVYDICILYSE